MARSTAGELATAIGAEVIGDPTTIVRSVTHDSAQVLDGTLFCCVTGERFDGHEFAAAAVGAGASVLLVSRQLDLDVTQLLVEDTRSAMGPLAAEFWSVPSQTDRRDRDGSSRGVPVIGVTGTNGKTTTVQLIGQLVTFLGGRCGVIGTLTGARTTPEATELQSQLRTFADAGYDCVAMEVSSHALALHRVDGTRFTVAVFTNIGIDHLDFHSTQERYFAAKARLFEPELSVAGITNVDDVHGRLLRDAASIPITPFGLDHIEDLVLTSSGSSFSWRGCQVQLPLAGRFNISNALAAAESVRALGYEEERIAEALHRVTAPPGRFEMVSRGQPFPIVVDYAHTPDALSNLLETARELVGGGRLFVVFGCGGDRDRSKRPEMGRVACEGADVVMLTSDNPRSEDPAAIIAAVKNGCTSPVLVEIDRRAAIGTVLAEARAGDVVVIAGKGHETTQTTGADVMAFDDRVIAADWVDEQLRGVQQ